MLRYLHSLFCKKRKHAMSQQAPASKRMKRNTSASSASTEEEVSSVSTDIPYSKHGIEGFLNITRINKQGKSNTLYGVFIIDKVSIRWICIGN